MSDPPPVSLCGHPKQVLMAPFRMQRFGKSATVVSTAVHHGHAACAPTPVVQPRTTARGNTSLNTTRLQDVLYLVACSAEFDFSNDTTGQQLLSLLCLANTSKAFRDLLSAGMSHHRVCVRKEMHAIVFRYKVSFFNMMKASLLEVPFMEYDTTSPSWPVMHRMASPRLLVNAQDTGCRTRAIDSLSRAQGAVVIRFTRPPIPRHLCALLQAVAGNEGVHSLTLRNLKWRNVFLAVGMLQAPFLHLQSLLLEKDYVFRRQPPETECEIDEHFVANLGSIKRLSFASKPLSTTLKLHVRCAGRVPDSEITELYLNNVKMDDEAARWVTPRLESGSFFSSNFPVLLQLVPPLTKLVLVGCQASQALPRGNEDDLLARFKTLRHLVILPCSTCMALLHTIMMAEQWHPYYDLVNHLDRIPELQVLTINEFSWRASRGFNPDLFLPLKLSNLRELHLQDFSFESTEEVVDEAIRLLQPHCSFPLTPQDVQWCAWPLLSDTLQSLSFTNCSEGHPGAGLRAQLPVKAIARLTNLRSLVVFNEPQNVYGKHAPFSFDLPDLENLELWNFEIDEGMMKSIASSARLKYLTLVWCGVTRPDVLYYLEAQVRSARALPSLTQVRIVHLDTAVDTGVGRVWAPLPVPLRLATAGLESGAPLTVVKLVDFVTLPAALLKEEIGAMLEAATMHGPRRQIKVDIRTSLSMFPDNLLPARTFPAGNPVTLFVAKQTGQTDTEERHVGERRGSIVLVREPLFICEDAVDEEKSNFLTRKSASIAALAAKRVY